MLRPKADGMRKSRMMATASFTSRPAGTLACRFSPQLGDQERQRLRTYVLAAASSGHGLG